MRRTRQQTLALDLGSSTLRLCTGPVGGAVLCAPSIVALDHAGKVCAWGADALRLRGRAPAELEVIQPVARGVVTHPHAAVSLLRVALRAAAADVGAPGPGEDGEAAVCVPDGATPLQRSALAELCEEAGLRRIRLIPKSLSHVVGLGLPVQEPSGALVVDVGTHRTSAAMMTMGYTMAARSSDYGGESVNAALAQHLRLEYGLMVSAESAEDAKLRLAHATSAMEPLPVRGKDLTGGWPRAQELAPADLPGLTLRLREEVVDLISAVMTDSPAELAHDVLDRGILLCGRGALLPGLEEHIRAQTRLPVHLLDPEGTASVIGAHRLAAQPESEAEQEEETGLMPSPV
ncbi:rod shape-determining protein [Actinomycetota bacterium Odt1-20B]